MFDGWAVSLDGVIFTNGCEHGVSCFTEDVTLDALLGPPDGLGLPGLRTEDVEFPQRDGAKHYSDWYEPRLVTVVGSLGPSGCEKCGDVRRQLRSAVEAWKRQCCDTELVIHTPCGGDVFDEFPVPELVTSRTNLMQFNGLGQAYTNHCGVYEFTDTRGFAGGAGTYSQFNELVDMPANVPTPQLVARKTWDSSITAHTLCFDGSGELCFVDAGGTVCFDTVTSGDNTGAGFLMGCTGIGAPTVEPGDVYTLSGYMRTNETGRNVLVRVAFYDDTGAVVASADGDPVATVAGQWVRVSATVTVPEGVTSMQFILDTDTGGPVFAAGDTLDATAVLIEKSDVLGSYFDGNSSDTDDKIVGGTKVEYSWTGGVYASTSVEETFVYVPGPDRALNGPFGVIGRPRVFSYEWLNHDQQIVNFTARFDAVDHRLYVLDSCGTPGSTDCVTVHPSTSQTRILCFDAGELCFDAGELCFTEVEPAEDAGPVEVDVLGTEPAYPVITLYPGLTNPRVQDVTSGQEIRYRGNLTVGEQPVVIETADGTATQGGVSVTHLIDGQLDFVLTPGTHELRLITQGLTDSGSADACWRPAVVMA